MGDGALPLPGSLAGREQFARPEPPPCASADQALRDAVAAPVAGPPLPDFLRDRRVLVVLPDATRPMPVALVEALLDAVGLSAVGVRIANGTHRRSTPQEQRTLLGRHFGRLPAGDRAADDASAHRALAEGWALDAALWEADAVVMMGPVAFHYLAGFGGGGKLLAPGLADRRTAEWVHRACLDPTAGRAARARPGVLAGNPLRERIEALCLQAPPQFLVAPLLDSAGRVTQVFAGTRAETFGAACRALAGHYALPARPHRTVVVSAGGLPYDLDFVQAHKALEAAAAACVPGGDLVFLADCAEGMPARHRAFLERHPDAASMERALRERFDIAGHTVWAAREKAERFHIRAVTRMPPGVVRALGMRPAASLEEALEGCDLDDALLLPFGARFLPTAPSDI